MPSASGMRLFSSTPKIAAARLQAYRELFKAQIDDDVPLIRVATNKGLAIGNDRFKKEVELLSGRRVTEKKRGPKPRAKVDEFLL